MAKKSHGIGIQQSASRNGHFCEKCVEIYIHDEVMAVEINKLLQGMVLFIDGQSHHEVMALEMSKVLQGMGDLYTDECHHETFHHGRFPFLSSPRPGFPRYLQRYLGNPGRASPRPGFPKYFRETFAKLKLSRNFAKVSRNFQLRIIDAGGGGALMPGA